MQTDTITIFVCVAKARGGYLWSWYSYDCDGADFPESGGRAATREAAEVAARASAIEAFPGASLEDGAARFATEYHRRHARLARLATKPEGDFGRLYAVSDWTAAAHDAANEGWDGYVPDFYARELRIVRESSRFIYVRPVDGPGSDPEYDGTPQRVARASIGTASFASIYNGRIEDGALVDASTVERLRAEHAVWAAERRAKIEARDRAERERIEGYHRVLGFAHGAQPTEREVYAAARRATMRTGPRVLFHAAFYFAHAAIERDSESGQPWNRTRFHRALIMCAETSGYAIDAVRTLSGLAIAVATGAAKRGEFNGEPIELVRYA